MSRRPGVPRARLAALAALALAGPALAPGAPATQQATVGPQYAAGGFHRAMLGSSYRALWTTPIEVEVLDLADRGAAGSRW